MSLIVVARVSGVRMMEWMDGWMDWLTDVVYFGGSTCLVILGLNQSSKVYAVQHSLT